MIYDLLKEKIPEIVESLFELHTPNQTDQKYIARDIVKHLTKKHRTAQQQIIKILSEILKEYSNQNYDPRNQDAVDYCRQIAKINNNFRYI